MGRKSSVPRKRSDNSAVLSKKGVGPLPAELSSLTNAISEAYAHLAAVAMDSIGSASRDLGSYPVEVQVKLLALMQSGWAVDPDRPILFVRLAQGEFGEEQTAETWIAGHFEARLDEIQSALADRHPERAAIISNAFDAHRRGLYTLSVPVFLAQADGIVGDRYERKQLFSKSKRSGLASQLDEMEPGQISTMWAEILSGSAEVSLNVRDLPDDFSGLNRHSILHGYDLKYGVRENSLKAVSILYMASHLIATSSNSVATEQMKS